jgi:hypothetical protein
VDAGEMALRKPEHHTVYAVGAGDTVREITGAS